MFIKLDFWRFGTFFALKPYRYYEEQCKECTLIFFQIGIKIVMFLSYYMSMEIILAIKIAVLNDRSEISNSQSLTSTMKFH